MRSQPWGIQIVPTDPIWTPSTTGICGAHTPRRALELILVFEAWRGEVWDGTPWWRGSEGVVKREGVRARWLGDARIGERILAGVAPRVSIFPVVLCLLARRGVLVAFLVQAGDELLYNSCFEEGGEVFDARLGDENFFELAGEVGAVLDTVSGEGDAQRERGGGDVVFGNDFETGDAFITEAEAADLGFAAESVDFDDVLE